MAYFIDDKESEYPGLTIGSLDIPDVQELWIPISRPVRLIWACSDDFRHVHRFRLTAWLCWHWHDWLSKADNQEG